MFPSSQKGSGAGVHVQPVKPLNIPRKGKRVQKRAAGPNFSNIKWDPPKEKEHEPESDSQHRAATPHQEQQHPPNDPNRPPSPYKPEHGLAYLHDPNAHFRSSIPIAPLQPRPIDGGPKPSWNLTHISPIPKNGEKKRYFNEPQPAPGFLPFLFGKSRKHVMPKAPRKLYLPDYLDNGGARWHGGPNEHLTSVLESLATILKIEVTGLTDVLMMLSVFDYHRNITDIWAKEDVRRSRFSGVPIAEVMIYYSCYIIVCGTRRIVPYPMVDVIEHLASLAIRRIDLIAASNQDDTPAISILGIYDYPPYGDNFKPSSQHPRDLFAMLIMFLDLLPHHLLPITLKDALLKFCIDPPHKIKNINYAEAATHLIHLLPEANFNFFAYLSTFFHNACDDRRSDLDLLTVATIFGPVIFNCVSPLDKREAVRAYKWVLFYWKDIERHLWKYVPPQCNRMPLHHRLARRREHIRLYGVPPGHRIPTPPLPPVEEYFAAEKSKLINPGSHVEGDKAPPESPILPTYTASALSAQPEHQPAVAESSAVATGQTRSLMPSPAMIAHEEPDDGDIDQLGELLKAQSRVFELEETMREMIEGMRDLEMQNGTMQQAEGALSSKAKGKQRMPRDPCGSGYV